MLSGCTGETVTERSPGAGESRQPRSANAERSSKNAGKSCLSSKNGHSIQPYLYAVSIFAIEPAPENETLYDPIRPDDAAFLELRRQIESQGMIDPIVVSCDGYIKWDTHRSVGTFVQRSLRNLFSGYWRDLLQSQPNWPEVVVEKNTVASSLRSIAAKYTVPMTSGRGYSSLPPRKDMVDRFRASGREKLIVIVVSDHDPEGEDIPNSFGVSLRDDFGLAPDQLVVVKAALTHQQATTLGLHEGQFAKEESSRFPRFAERYGTRCWELEAVPTDILREIVEHAIRSVLDLEAFDAELAKERAEQAELDECRARVKAALARIDPSHKGE